MAYVLLLKAETSGCRQARMSLKGLQEELKVQFGMQRMADKVINVDWSTVSEGKVFNAGGPVWAGVLVPVLLLWWETMTKATYKGRHLIVALVTVSED